MYYAVTYESALAKLLTQSDQAPAVPGERCYCGPVGLCSGCFARSLLRAFCKTRNRLAVMMTLQPPGRHALVALVTVTKLVVPVIVIDAKPLESFT